MRNIIWTKPDSTTAVTYISQDYPDTSSQHATELQTPDTSGNTILPRDWVATAFDQDIET